MGEEIVVRVLRRAGRKTYQAEWKDPTTGKVRSKALSATTRRDAERIAAGVERELRAGIYRDGSVPWSDAKERYLDEGVAGLSEGTVVSVSSTFTMVDALIAPRSLQVLARPEVLAKFRRLLSAEPTRYGKPRSPSTVNKHLRNLSAVFGWAKRAGLLMVVPDLPYIRREGSGAKSRPIVTEEFERMLASVGAVAGDEAAEVALLLRGLWETGLRIGEAMSLKWGEGPVSLERRRSGWSICFSPEGQKARRSEVVPLTPDAEALIDSIPEGRRTGFVFMPSRKRRKPDDMSRMVSLIGKTARVFTTLGDSEGNRKPGSAHDLRRAFATRWASRVTPQVLAALMRHRSPTTTATFYVAFDVDGLAEAVRRASPTDKITDSEPVRAVGAAAEDDRKPFSNNDFRK